MSGGLERVGGDEVHVVPARRTVVLAVPLEPIVRDRLGALLDARIIDVLTDCPEAELLIYPPSSPQLLVELKEKYPHARVVVAELEDLVRDIDRTGPVTRLLRAGADTYVVAHSLEDLVYKLGVVPPPASSASAAQVGKEHSSPNELVGTESCEDLSSLLGRMDAPTALPSRRPAGLDGAHE